MSVANRRLSVVSADEGAARHGALPSGPPVAGIAVLEVRQAPVGQPRQVIGFVFELHVQRPWIGQLPVPVPDHAATCEDALSTCREKSVSKCGITALPCE